MSLKETQDTGSKKILIIDDDREIINLCVEFLKLEGYQVSYSFNGDNALALMDEDIFDVVLLDIQMPGMDGFDVLKQIKGRGIPIIIITAFGTVANAIRALRSGASDFIVKPFSLDDLSYAVRKNIQKGETVSDVSHVNMAKPILELNRIIATLTELDLLLDKVLHIVKNIYQSEITAIYIAGEEGENFTLRNYMPVKDKLPEQLPVSYRYEQVKDIFVKRKSLVEKTEHYKITVPILGTKKEIGFMYLEIPATREISEEEIKFLEIFALQVGIGIENAMLFDMLRNAYINSIKSLVNSLEAKDAYTKGHSEQVAYYSVLIGRRLGIRNQNLEILKNASYLHDLGKLGIRDSILLKPGPLSEEEKLAIMQHPCMTVKILEPLGLKKEEIDACYYHHETIDGKGYPSGLKGDEIPLLSKIIAVADAYSAMISERPYRKAMKHEEAVAELKKCVNKQFDKEIVETFIEILKEEKRR
ncbi:MAG: HD domain-containing phosphohydrolase [Candidatus Ratteibacteria bacterium]